MGVLETTEDFFIYMWLIAQAGPSGELAGIDGDPREVQRFHQRDVRDTPTLLMDLPTGTGSMERELSRLSG